MRKLNQLGRPKAVPCLIPRPPTPPHSLEVQALKSILLSNQQHQMNNSKQSNNKCKSDNKSSTVASVYSHTAMSDDRVTRNYSQVDSSSSSIAPSGAGSSNTCLSFGTFDAPEDAIEPNSDFPPPPEEFLEDIRANRKQEEIEGPLDASPSVTPPDSIASSDIDIRQHLHCIQRNSHSSYGYGSLNSSIAEPDATDSNSWSPSPTASPLTSPSHSSVDSASIQSLVYQAPSSSHHHHHHSSPSRFLFPPSHPNGALNANKPCQQGVTLAPLLSCTLQREPIYQRLPMQRAPAPASHSAPASHCTPASHSTLSPPPAPLSSSPPSDLLSNGPTGTIARPPDYQTSMKRLSLAKANCSHQRSNPACKQHVVQLHAQNINTCSVESVPSPLVTPNNLPIATVNPRRQPSSPPPASLVTRHLTKPIATIDAPHRPSDALDITFASSSSSPSQSFNDKMHCNGSTNTPACDEVYSAPSSSSCSRSSSHNESSVHDSSHQQLPLPPRAVHSPAVMRGDRVICIQKSATTSLTERSPPSSCTNSTGFNGFNGFNGSSGTRSLPATPASASAKGGGHGCAPSPMKEKVRKRVSFSDQVALVAHSEDMIQEQLLPNPVLERVLGRAFLQYNRINNG